MVFAKKAVDIFTNDIVWSPISRRYFEVISYSLYPEGQLVILNGVDDELRLNYSSRVAVYHPERPTPTLH